MFRMGAEEKPAEDNKPKMSKAHMQNMFDVITSDQGLN